LETFIQKFYPLGLSNLMLKYASSQTVVEALKFVMQPQIGQTILQLIFVVIVMMWDPTD
jgi:hypothetical protein